MRDEDIFGKSVKKMPSDYEDLDLLSSRLKLLQNFDRHYLKPQITNPQVIRQNVESRILRTLPPVRNITPLKQSQKLYTHTEKDQASLSPKLQRRYYPSEDKYLKKKPKAVKYP